MQNARGLSFVSKHSRPRVRDLFGQRIADSGDENGLPDSWTSGATAHVNWKSKNLVCLKHGVEHMRSGIGSPRILSWWNALSQRSPLDKGNEGSGNEIGYAHEQNIGTGNGDAHKQSIICSSYLQIDIVVFEPIKKKGETNRMICREANVF